MRDNHWTYWSHLAMLHLNIDDNGNLQRLEFEVKNDPLVTYQVDGRALDFSSPALGVLLKICGISSPVSKDIELYDVKRGLAKWYSTNVASHSRKLGKDTAQELEELFRLRNSPDGWKEVDSLTKLLAGKTLSALVDSSSSVLFDPQDPKLGCENPFYAQVYKGAMVVLNPDTDLMTYEDQIRMNCGFVASSLDRLMKNVMTHMGQFHQDGVDARECPDYVSIYRGPLRILSFPLKKCGESGHGLEMIYSRIEWNRTGQGLLKDLLSAIPEEAHHKVRGTMFAEELGV